MPYFSSRRPPEYVSIRPSHRPSQLDGGRPLTQLLGLHTAPAWGYWVYNSGAPYVDPLQTSGHTSLIKYVNSHGNLTPWPVPSAPNTVRSHIATGQDLVRGADRPYPKSYHPTLNLRSGVFSLERGNISDIYCNTTSTQNRGRMGLDRRGRQMQGTLPQQATCIRGTARIGHCGLAPILGPDRPVLKPAERRRLSNRPSICSWLWWTWLTSHPPRQTSHQPAFVNEYMPPYTKWRWLPRLPGPFEWRHYTHISIGNWYGATCTSLG
jgi:hypothetical protein